MPELPEVETTVRGISPLITGNKVTKLVVRDSRLRWPVPDTLESRVVGNRILSVRRRAKYILIKIGTGHMLLHLGMSGSIRLSSRDEPPGVHDHVELEISNDLLLRLRDSRRFGCVLWIEGDPAEFHLLANLGPEPLSEDFGGEYLYANSRNRRLAVKSLIMDSRVVVGVGNIYASEALFRAGINPIRRVNRISVDRYRLLAKCIQNTMSDAIAAGGTTLRDFVNGTGDPGYFSQDLLVYEREGMPCKLCATSISRRVIGQRSTYYCGKCQT